MFNVGASIPGRYPHLEGGGPNARFSISPISRK
jgi:hypothetical protein